MQLSREEQETSIVFDASSKTASVFSANPAIIRRLNKIAESYPEAYKCIKIDRWGGHHYEMPVHLIQFRKPASEKQRAAGREKACNLLKQRQKSVCNTEGDKL